MKTPDGRRPPGSRAAGARPPGSGAAGCCCALLHLFAFNARAVLRSVVQGITGPARGPGHPVSSLVKRCRCGGVQGTSQIRSGRSAAQGPSPRIPVDRRGHRTHRTVTRQREGKLRTPSWCTTIFLIYITNTFHVLNCFQFHNILELFVM